MRVLIANKFFFRNGGSEVVMFQERDYLKQSGIEVVDFSMCDERNIASPYSSYFVGAREYRAGARQGGILAALSFIHSHEAVRNIGRLIDDTKPDLVHCHNIYHQLTPSIIGAAKSRSVPVVLTLHDSKPVCPSYTRLANGKPCSACLEGGSFNVVKNRCADGSLARSCLMFLEAIVQRSLGSYEAVDRFIVPSRFMMDSVATRFPKDRLALLYNGVDAECIHKSEIDGGYVLYLGRLSREKGVETLLRAHEKSSMGWQLRIAGTGPLANELQSRFSRADFLGHLSGDILQKTIQEAALIVLPSECYENCPMSVLEAMAYGKPVVGSRLGGIPELVRDGETGRIFEAGDVAQLRQHLDDLMANPDQRRAMGLQGRARVETEFSLNTHNAGLLAVYQSVLASI